MENNAKIDPKRLPVLEAYHQGKTVEEISQNCPGISRATIYNWIKEYKEGKVSRKPRAQTAEKKRLYAAALAFHKEGYSICEIQRADKISLLRHGPKVGYGDKHEKQASSDKEEADPPI